MRFIVVTLVLLVSLVLVPVTSVFAHSPVFPQENHGPSTAYEIDDPAKSWAIYTWLEHEGVADFYKFTVSEGDKIQVSLIVPDNPARSGFLPAFTLIGPGITKNDIVPDYVEVPMDYGTIVVNGTDSDEAVYEPFTPGWFYELGILTMSAPRDGTYYVAVFNPEIQENGHNHLHKDNAYAIIVGYVEEFTPLELILIPYRVHGIYVWEGQNQFIIFLPILLIVIIGGLITYQRSKRGQHPTDLSKWLATFGGLAFVGTAAGTIYQIVFTFTRTGITVEALITLVIVIVSIVLGVLTLRYALRRKQNLTIWRRVGLLVIALVALFFWSGLYLGPGLLIASAIVPPYGKNRKHSLE